MSSMYDAERIVSAIKMAALDAVNATYPVQVCYGTVVSVSPLEVKLSQQLTLNERQLLLTASVTEQQYETDIPGITLTMKSGLTQGEIVLLLRMQGGQKYIIIDRVVI